VIYLQEDSLGTLDLECINGLVVQSFEIGFPTVREVVVSRALTDGAIDTTKYLGSRAVTVALRLDQKKMATQALLDLLMPYLSPRIRPRIVWRVQSPSVEPNPAYVRSLQIRGADAPVVIEGPKYQTIILQWVAQEPYAEALEDTCAVAVTTGTEEFGRDYDLEFDRDYPFSPPFGVTLFNTLGNAPMDWFGTITSEVVDPRILINNTEVIFTGVNLTAGQTIEIDTLARTILRNGTPTDSLYGLTNFQDWTWDDLRLVPGQNLIRMQADSFTGQPSFTLCWLDRWFV
jgi:hypothetical protein